MKRLHLLIGIFIIVVLAAGCSGATTGGESYTSAAKSESTVSTQEERSEIQESEKESESDMTQTKTAPELIYFGHASMCIITEDDKVIYVDPFESGDYSRTADLILVTHDHYDHNQLDMIENRSADCEIITQTEALQNGEHRTFEYPFVKVEAVEAGNNPNHDINSCVGYVLTFNNGKTVYISGDTSTTEQMSELSERNIDYAFYCCDGVFNMDNEEAASCAETVGAKHNIPYHNETANGKQLDKALADSWGAPNKMIVLPGETINIE